MIVFTAIFLLVSSAFAECPSPQSAQRLLECAVGGDPAVRLAQVRLAQAQAEARSTRQRPNPELETKGTWGEGASQVEVDLVQPLETGGKRGARIALGQAGEDFSTAELTAAKAETALKTVSALYRLRQVQSELSLIEEALSTFSRIGEQLRSRPRLAPEQEVSRSIFELAAADYALRQASLSAERKGLLTGLETSIGIRLSTVTLSLPQPRQEWPEIPETSSIGDASLLQAQAELKAAKAERGAAQAASWPDLRLGPSFQRQSSEGQSQRMFGLNLALPLPIYHRNAAGRERARRGEEAAAFTAAAIQAKVQAEREAERARYEAAVAALRTTANRGDVHAKHERIEDFFQRGLISSTLVIEAHRQMLEFARDRNELELAAIRSLWRIRAIDGQLLGETL
jgi:cobalt-zinc-cadmium efflux system outer membrane protein